MRVQEVVNIAKRVAAESPPLILGIAVFLIIPHVILLLFSPNGAFEGVVYLFWPLIVLLYNPLLLPLALAFLFIPCRQLATHIPAGKLAALLGTMLVVHVIFVTLKYTVAAWIGLFDSSLMDFGMYPLAMMLGIAMGHQHVFGHTPVVPQLRLRSHHLRFVVVCAAALLHIAYANEMPWDFHCGSTPLLETVVLYPASVAMWRWRWLANSFPAASEAPLLPAHSSPSKLGSVLLPNTEQTARYRAIAEEALSKRLEELNRAKAAGAEQAAPKSFSEKQES